jgi:Domain of unknown function (DUF6968)
MDLKDVGEIIGSREFEIALVDGSREVILHLGKPRPFPDSSGFFCPIQIVGVGDEKVRYAGGVDEIQSLQLALRMAGVLLETLAADVRANLRWKGNTDLGLDVS